MWLWGLGEDVPGRPVAEYDDDASSVGSWRLTEGGDDVGIDGAIVFRVRRAKVAKVHKYQSLPAGSVVLVKGQVFDALKCLPEEQIDFHPATVNCADGSSQEFVVARPKIECICTDVEQSDVTWVRKNEFFVMWKRLSFLPGCMAGCSIVREKYSRQIVVSDELKSTLTALEAKGIDFMRPEESRRGYAPWVE